MICSFSATSNLPCSAIQCDQHVVDLSNSFVDDLQPKDPLTGHFLRNINYEVPKERGEWKDAQPMLLAKLVVRVDDVDGPPLVSEMKFFYSSACIALFVVNTSLVSLKSPLRVLARIH